MATFRTFTPTPSTLADQDRLQLAARALALVRAGHVEAAVGVYRALGARFPEAQPFASEQIAALELLLAGEVA